MACRATDSGGGSRAPRRGGWRGSGARDEERGAAGLAGSGRWAGAAACERLTARTVGRGARWVRKRSFYYYKVSLSGRGGLHCGAREQRPGRGRGRALELGGGRWESFRRGLLCQALGAKRATRMNAVSAPEGMRRLGGVSPARCGLSGTLGIVLYILYSFVSYCQGLLWSFVSIQPVSFAVM